MKCEHIPSCFFKPPIFIERNLVLNNTRVFLYFLNDPRPRRIRLETGSNFQLYQSGRFEVKANAFSQTKPREYSLGSGDDLVIAIIDTNMAYIIICEMIDGLTPINPDDWEKFIKDNQGLLLKISQRVDSHSIDWEYPDVAFQGINHGFFDHPNFNSFLQEISNEVNEALKKPVTKLDPYHPDTILEVLQKKLALFYLITKNKYRKYMLEPLSSVGSVGMAKEWLNGIFGIQVIIVPKEGDRGINGFVGYSVIRSLADIITHCGLNLNNGRFKPFMVSRANPNRIFDGFAATVIENFGEEGIKLVRGHLYPLKVDGIYATVGAENPYTLQALSEGREQVFLLPPKQNISIESGKSSPYSPPLPRYFEIGSATDGAWAPDDRLNQPDPLTPYLEIMNYLRQNKLLPTLSPSIDDATAILLSIAI